MPSVTIVLHGRKDRYGRQVLYLRYAHDYSTNYISTGFKVLAKDWDPVATKVRARSATLGGESATRINMALNTLLENAMLAVLKLVEQKNGFAFEKFKGLVFGEEMPEMKLFEVCIKVIDAEKAQGVISKATHRAYKAGVSAWVSNMGNMSIFDIKNDDVTKFISILTEKYNANLAAQYCRNIKSVLNKVLKAEQIDIKNQFERALPINRISDKKQITVSEYLLLRDFFLKKATEKERETLRCFFICCRGARWSEAMLIKKEHYRQEVVDGFTYRYFVKPKQKTKTAAVVPITDWDAEHLLQYGLDDRLFKASAYQTFINRLQSITLAVIGRAITSHYGRHFAGDMIINDRSMDRDDVKNILGIKSTEVSEIYAERKALDSIRKFYDAVASMELK